MKFYIETLKNEFERNGNADIAVSQAKYMRDKFEYHGMKSPERRAASRPFLMKESLPDKSELEEYIHALWFEDKRDFQYFGMDLAGKYLKQTTKSDIALYQFMIENKSWWDTVLVGNYFRKFPEEIEAVTSRWLNSDDIWLQRSVLIFQLKYKEEVDVSLLEKSILKLNGTKEFFINKAIGWALRSYARVNPEWVQDFVDNHELSNLSRREALKHLS